MKFRFEKLLLLIFLLLVTTGCSAKTYTYFQSANGDMALNYDGHKYIQMGSDIPWLIKSDNTKLGIALFDDPYVGNIKYTILAAENDPTINFLVLKPSFFHDTGNHPLIREDIHLPSSIDKSSDIISASMRDSPKNQVDRATLNEIIKKHTGPPPDVDYSQINPDPNAYLNGGIKTLLCEVSNYPQLLYPITIRTFDNENVLVGLSNKHGSITWSEPLSDAAKNALGFS